MSAEPLPSGTGTYCRIHYTADPDKRNPEWVAAQKKMMSLREWRVQMEMDDTVYPGEPVFPEYNDKIHCLETVTRGQLAEFPIYDQSLFFGGWDCGNTLSPAFCLVQLTAMRQVLVMGELTCDVPMAMETFAPWVYDYLRKRFPKVQQIRHVGDESGNARQGATGKSAFDVARKHGFAIAPVSNAWSQRQGAVVWGLMDWIDEDTPRWMISSTQCPVLHRGMLGAYQIQTSTLGEETGPGAIFGMPRKDGYSHVQDGHQAAMVVVRRVATAPPPKSLRRFGKDDDEDEARINRLLGM